MMEEKTQVIREESVQETPTGTLNTQVTKKQYSDSSASAFKAKNLVYFLFGVLEFLLGLRFIFRLLGANPGSPFVAFIYSLTDIFVAPFRGIFSNATTNGAETTAVFEPAVAVAIIVYAFIAWGLAKLVEILTNPKSA